MQDLRGSRRVNKQKGIEKNNDIFSTQWDLMIVDEAHEGVYSRLGQEVIAAFLQNRSLHTLYLSGTPYNIQRMFDTREVFHWDYTMEQQAKQQWTSLHPNTTNPYEGLAQMNILTYDISDKMRSLTKADGLNFAELFRTETTVDNTPKHYGPQHGPHRFSHSTKRCRLYRHLWSKGSQWCRCSRNKGSGNGKTEVLI